MVSELELAEFPQQNVVYAKNQPQYRPLPAYKVPNDNQGCIIFCWKLNWKQRIKLLFTGKVWHRVLTFNQPLQPQLLELNTPFTKLDK